MNFSDDFFKDEVRTDFLIPEMMKRAWAAHLKILEELQVLFKEYDLIYYADFGTLLGAVRHKGIIPWDDDIDISMPRKDFMKFLEHADELPPELRVLSVYNSDTFVNFHAVATNNRAEILEWDENRMKSFYNCPFICYIDIFPMDYIPKDPDKAKLMRQLYSYAYKMVHTCEEIETGICGGELISRMDIAKGLEKYDAKGQGMAGTVSSFDAQLKDLEGFLKRFYGNSISIEPYKPLRHQLCLVTEYIATSCSEKDAARVDYCPHMAYAKKDLSRQKEWVQETIDLPFEGMTIAAPKMYHEVLVSRFGQKYMVPRHEKSTHEYPYYRTQVEVLVGGDTGENSSLYGNKKALLGAVDIIQEAGGVLHDYIEKDQASAMSLLADLQENAVIVGQSIEESGGEGLDSVKKLEQYCESVYHIYDALQSGGGTCDSSEPSANVIRENESKLDSLLQGVKHDIYKEIHQEIPKEWMEKLSNKKIVIYGLSAIELLNHGSEAAGKIQDVKKIFEDSHENLAVILCIPNGFSSFMERVGLEARDGYDRAISELTALPFIIKVEESEMDLAVSVADAYYGDPCPLMDRCKEAGLPIMIQSYEITR